MKVEVQYINGCQNHVAAVELIRQVMGEMHVTGDLVETEIKVSENVNTAGFLGSPTIRVDGVDVEPAARGASSAGYACRSYLNGAKRQGIPTTEMIRNAIRHAVGG